MELKSVNEMLIDIREKDELVAQALTYDGMPSFSRVQPIYDLIKKSPLNPTNIKSLNTTSKDKIKVMSVDSLFRGFYNQFSESHESTFTIGAAVAQLTNVEAKIIQSLLLLSISKSEKLMNEAMSLMIESVKLAIRKKTFWELEGKGYYEKILVKEIHNILEQHGVEQPILPSQEASVVKGRAKDVTDKVKSKKKTKDEK